MSYSLDVVNGLNLAFNSGALAIGGTTTQVQTGAAVNYSIDGVIKQLAATAAIPLPAPSAVVATQIPTGIVGAKVIPAGSKCGFSLAVDGAGNIVVTQGPLVSNNTDDCPIPVPLVVGDTVAGSTDFSAGIGGVVFAAFTVSTVTNAFTPGTTALNAAGVTVNYYNLACLPGSALA